MFMRIITGKYKGRTLVAPKTDTRPTLDRTKETLFNVLSPLISGSVVLDLFAGSGQLALECLSRNAKRAILCDNGKDAVQAIKANFQKVGEVPELYVCDYARCLARLSGANVDLVFVDPPYKAGIYLNVLTLLQQHQVVAQGGMVVCEHSAQDALPEVLGNFCVCDKRKMGTVQFTFYKNNGSATEEICE